MPFKKKKAAKVEEPKVEEIVTTDEELEVQTTFNEDSIEELIDSEDCVLENLAESEEE